ncbi:MAG TPA: hypothetical protein PKD85_21800, partial [Saprospiraceae bacterium]|nr:hypothetical protein [Saprospiraceae bacterium]
MRHLINFYLFTTLLIIVIITSVAFYNIRDRNKGYETNIHKGFNYKAKNIFVGIGIEPISPLAYDTWIDLDSNFTYEPENGDTYNDVNKNGKFDPIWMGGFHNNRPINGVHDDLWARCLLFDDGNTKLALVAVDAIGVFHDHVIDVRKEIKKLIPEIDHVVITASHSHQT